MDRKFVNTVGCILIIILFVAGCVIGYLGTRTYHNVLAGRPEYDYHMTYPEFYESLDWGNMEHSSEDTMNAYEKYLHENLSEAGREAELAEDLYRKGAKCCFAVGGIFLTAVIIINLTYEIRKYNRAVRH